MRRSIVGFLAVLWLWCGASVGSGGVGMGTGEGVPAESGATCSQRPAIPSCDDGYEQCNVVSEMDGCAYVECVPAGQCNAG